MRIYLLRHGPAAQPDGTGDDSQRPLTQAGQDLVRAAMQHHVRHLPAITHIWHSPYLRARQTASILASALQDGGRERAETEQRDDLVPGARPTTVLDAVQVAAWEHRDAGRVLVGHEPHLGRLLGLLIAGSEPMGIPLMPGMLAGVEVGEPRTMAGRLVFCMAAEDAAAMVDGATREA